MKKIKLTQNKHALVDNTDFDWLNKFKWYASWNPSTKGFYATRGLRIGKTLKTLTMHRVIMNTPKRKMTDHINGNTLDNRKSNLRICHNNENQTNTKNHRNNKMIGITIRKHKHKTSYEAQKNGIYLGTFPSTKLARQAYLNNIKPQITTPIPTWTK